MLRPSATGGVVAIVTLPNDALASAAELPAGVPEDRNVRRELMPASAAPQPQSSSRENPLRSSLPPVPPQRSGTEHSGEHVALPRTEAPTASPESQTPQGSQPASEAPAPLHAEHKQWRYQEPPPPADPTVEMPLPIFNAVESEWFRPVRPVNSDTDDATSALSVGTSERSRASEKSAPARTTEPARPTSEPLPGPISASTQAPPPTSNTHSSVEDSTGPNPQDTVSISSSKMDTSASLWASAADEGWQRAEAAADPQIGDTTPAGLPKRVPSANYVPGGVEKQPVQPRPDETRHHAPKHRSPDAVRGVLASYRQGWEQGRVAGRSRRAAVVTDSDDAQDSPHGQQEEQQ